MQHSSPPPKVTPILPLPVDAILPELVRKGIVVGEANKTEISKVDGDLVLLAKKVDSLSTRVTLGFSLLFCMVAFCIALLAVILVRMP